MGSFAQNFIDAYARGQQARRNKRIEEQETEDRDTEKQILQHKLKELKIADRIRAREAAIQNAKALEGSPESNLPWDGSSMKGAEAPQGMGIIPGSKYEVPNRTMPRINIPGIDELGVGGIDVQPRTMEQELAEQFALIRQRAMMTPRNVGRGTNMVIPGMDEDGDGQADVIAEGDDFPEATHEYRNWDPATGKETVERLTDEEIRARPPARRRPPQTSGGGGGANMLTDEDREDFEVGVIDGTIPPDMIPKTIEGLRIGAGLKRKGFNLSKAQADIRAFRTFMGGLNQGKQQEILVASDAALDALDALEARIDKDGDGVRFPGTKQAADLEQAAAGIRTQLAILKSGGAAPTNKALEAAEAELTTGLFTGKLKPKIARLRESLKYRVASVKGSFVSPTEIPGSPIPNGGTGGAVKKDPGGIR